MLNIEKLTYLLLARTFPDLTVAPELDVHEVGQNEYPILLFSVTGGNAIDGGSGKKPSAWDCVLNLSIIDNDLDSAITLADTVYDGVWSWGNAFSPAGIVDGLGHVAEIEDQSVFTRVSTVIVNDRSITHMAGSFTFQAHQQ